MPYFVLLHRLSPVCNEQIEN